MSRGYSSKILQPYPPNTSICCRLAVCLIIVLVCCLPIILFKICSDPCLSSLLGRQDDFIDMGRFVKIEGLDPDDRDIFDGFKTSFIPVEDVSAMRDRRSIDVYGNVIDDNLTADQFLWGDVDGDDMSYPSVYRKKRMAYYPPYPFGRDPHPKTGTMGYLFENSFHMQQDSEHIDEISTTKNNISDEELDSMIPQEHHVDRGPFDDLVEQVRRQPELEEGEMAAAAHVYKNTKSNIMIHSFWKGQGDRTTIRNTQANIMRQYMDAEADPCDDFYQYACGNWAPLNPIPPDKAGYDTFEMLRENLDAVLKDLLEFKKSERVKEIYPGSHLDLRGNFLNPTNKQQVLFKDLIDMELADFEEIDRITNLEINKLKIGKENKTEILERLRRYLDKKSKRLHLPFHNKIKLALKKLKHRRYKTVKSDNIAYFNKRSIAIEAIAHPTNPSNIITTPVIITEDPHRNKATIDSTIDNATPGNASEINKQSNKIPAIAEKRRRIKRKSQLEKDADFLRNLSSTDKPNRPGDSEPEDPANGDAALKSRFLFKSCMNYAILEKRGHQPLLDLLNLLGGWPILNPNWDDKNFDWLELMAKLRLFNNDILISEWVGPDIKNSDEFVIQFDQTSLGLPTRDYFLQKSNKIYLDAYKQYLITIGILLGGNKAYVKQSANELIEFEIKLAKITSAPEDRRNVSELYRRMPLRKLEELVPEVKWRRYLCVVMNRTVRSDEVVVLFALSYVRHLVALIRDTPPKILSNYLLWRFVRHRVNNLDDRFQSAKQQFYFVLFGREEAPPRWKNCISQVNSNMGMALGSMFVRKYFDETSKNDTLTMTREIQQSFRELLHLTNWIDDATKKLAAHKVDAMMLRIGYPDFILNKKELDDRYKEVKIHPDKYFENILNILQHLTKMEQGRLGQPVNKTLWNTAPAVVNAYYSRNKNQIMFPAGILQPPFYHRHFPRSLNYGGIGVVIGHEITHGFDDKGRLFDCDGNLHRWWSDTAIEAFHRRAQCLIDQYGHYVVPEVNMKLNGVNTQGENIADNGGVKQAFRAYVRWLKKNGPEGETLPGLNHTHTQLFFLNFAQVWCGAMRPEAMRNKLKTAVHSPGRFRVIGTLSNSHDFAREFRCRPGSPMNPISKCTVW